MTESDVSSNLGADESDDPRRLVLADLVARLAAGVAAQARAYEAAAGQAEGALRHSLQELARAKHAQAADLGPLARALSVPGPSSPPILPPGSPPSWGAILGEVFQGERALGRLGRDLAILASAPAVTAVAARLAAGADRDRQEVRRLHLRYT
jgi:hypothetical protein